MRCSALPSASGLVSLPRLRDFLASSWALTLIGTMWLLRTRNLSTSTWISPLLQLLALFLRGLLLMQVSIFVQVFLTIVCLIFLGSIVDRLLTRVLLGKRLSVLLSLGFTSSYFLIIPSILSCPIVAVSGGQLCSRQGLYAVLGCQ